MPTPIANRLSFQRGRLLLAETGFVLACFTAAQSAGQTFSVLHSFKGVDGGAPVAGLALAADGETLVGTTRYGGSSAAGVLFKMRADGTGYSVLKSFGWPLADGLNPQAALVLSGVMAYGAASGGGDANNGLLFRVNIEGGDFFVLHRFSGSDGGQPTAPLILSGSTLFGTTSGGGNAGYGTVFKINYDGGGYSVLKGFNLSEGSPGSGAMALAGSTLYGTTTDGGNSGYGTLFRLNANSTEFTVLHSFDGDNDGRYPHGLILSGDKLFGASFFGGRYGLGTIYRLNTNGTGFTVLKDCDSSSGAQPLGGVLVSDTVLYGTTAYGGASNLGTIFKLGIDGSSYSALYNFADFNTGYVPQGALVLAGSALYGTTAGSMDSSGYGCVVFALSLPGPPSILRSPSSQTVAAGFSADLSVDANGVPPLGYQWFFSDLKPIQGKTNSVLELIDLRLSQSGSYLVVVSNAYGAVTSSPAVLSVMGVPPSITVPPLSRSGGPGARVDVSVGATGSIPLDYQWLFNDTNLLAAATNMTLEIVDFGPALAGAYKVVVSNSFGAVTSSPALLSLVFPVVTNFTEEALRDAMAFGGRVTFAGDGTIALASPITNAMDITLDALGHHVTISGANIISGAQVISMFQVETNVSFSVKGLILANAHAYDGAAILNQGGVVRLLNTVFLTNSAQRSGGGVLNDGGTVNATNCTFIGNSVRSFPTAKGGALCNVTGQMNLDHCLFYGNTASGGDGVMGAGSSSAGADGLGGAVCSHDALTVFACSFLGNAAHGGSGGQPFGIYPGGPGGSGSGGALCNLGEVLIRSSTFASNTASGGAGAFGGISLGGRYPDGTIGQPGNPGAPGGSGEGGGLFNSGTAILTNCTFAWNTGTGGDGGGGGPGTPTGGAYNGPGGDGGAGGIGGSASGGFWTTSGHADVVNCTFAYNSATFGAGGGGGSGGSGQAAPAGQPGAPGSSGSAAGGTYNLAGMVRNTLLASNSPVNSIGGSGSYNLSSDASCPAAFCVPGLNLGPLADNGGPTLTIALLPSSPAIDAGDVSLMLSTDQRGVARAFGFGIDIGAFEYWPSPPTLRATVSGQAIDILATGGPPGQSCHLFASTDLAIWTLWATNQFDTTGKVLFPPVPVDSSLRFYKLSLP